MISSIPVTEVNENVQLSYAMKKSISWKVKRFASKKKTNQKTTNQV